MAIAALCFSLALAAPQAKAAGSITVCTASGASFAGGAGTSASPYLVSNQTQLAAINSSTYRQCAFKQTADIALTGDWVAIGENGNIFRGEYDGDNQAISSINISGITVGYRGLFGYTEAAIIKNLRIAGTVNISGGWYIGGLVGLAESGTEITNVHSSVNVTGGNEVGGLVGWARKTKISRSSASGNVTGSGDHVGGLAGYAQATNGLLTSQIIDSYATGSVGGDVGSRGVAGLVGAVANSSPGVRVTNSYATGAVAGGTGSREEGDCPGDHCITITGTTGGLIALDTAGDSYGGNLAATNSFWDTQTTVRASTADGSGSGLTTAQGGQTTAQMKSYSQFNGAGWNIYNGWSRTATWGICDGTSYPFLSAQYSSSPCPQQLNVAKTGSGGGTVSSLPAGIDCGPTCSTTFESGRSVTLTATPASGSSFSGWSGSGCTGTSTCALTMSEARSVTAEFGVNAPTPRPIPKPSNITPTPKLRISKNAMTSTVTVPGPGALSQLATRSSNAAALLTVCKATGKARKAGPTKLTCKYTAAARKALRRGSLRVSLKTTFTPTGGTARTTRRTIVLKSQRPSATR